jgi:hypothetical protein
VIANSTIAGNTTNWEAVRLDSSATLRNTTIADNNALESAVYTFATVNLGNTIVSGPGVACAGSGGGTYVSSGNNIESDGTCAPSGTDKSNTNPQLAALANNGGPTQTMAIATSSPAFDAGSNLLCAAAPVSNVDQRGAARPQGATCDIGAFELTPGPPSATPPDNTFSLGKLKLKPNGTAVLPVTVNAAGVLSVADTKKHKKLVKTAQGTLKAPGTVKVMLKPTSTAKSRFAEGKSVKTKLRIVFTPTGGSANTAKAHVRLHLK